MLATDPTNRYQSALLAHFALRRSEVFCRHVGDVADTVLTWGDLEAECGRFADAYRRASLAPRDQILIFLRHRHELYGTFFGAMLSGIVPAYMPCTSPRQDASLYWRSHQELLNAIKPAAVVTDQVTLREMRDAGLSWPGERTVLIDDAEPARLEPLVVDEGEVAFLQHSSGTTGLKKGVRLTFNAVCEQIERYGRALRISPEDAIVSWLPLYHDMGLIACLILPAFFATPVTHIDPFDWIGRPATLFDHIQRDRGTLTWMPNFAFEHLAATLAPRANEWDLSSMRAFVNCSEPCKPLTFDRFARTFAASGVSPQQLQCCYAMAESVFAVAQTDLWRPPRRVVVDPVTTHRGATPAEVTSGTGEEIIEVGRGIDGVVLTIHDEDGAEIDDGKVGEIALAAPFLFAGYNVDSVRTDRRLREGRYFTGDLGFIRQGRLFVLGRIDDVIIINGRNLYAHEIERVIGDILGLKAGRVAALRWFDPRIGSATLIVMAERALSDTSCDTTLRHAITTTIQSIFGVSPRQIVLIGPGLLVKTSSGKISRAENLSLYLRHRNSE